MSIHYSPYEERLIKLLRKRKNKKVTTLELVDAIYPSIDDRPPFARNTVTTMIKRLNRKLELQKAGFTICSERLGPNPSQYWIQ